jgi:hypothetical protein
MFSRALLVAFCSGLSSNASHFESLLKMVTVGKCCLCFRLSTGGIILGCFGAFSSLLVVIVIGGFLLSYDNFVKSSYQKGDAGDEDSRKIAQFLDVYKNGNKFLINLY